MLLGIEISPKEKSDRVFVSSAKILKRSPFLCRVIRLFGNKLKLFIKYRNFREIPVIVL